MFNKPTTLHDLGLTQSAVDKVQQTILNINSEAAVTPDGSPPTFEQEEVQKAPTTGQFKDKHKNEVWRVLASQIQEGYEQLADLDMLEADPTNRKQAMKNK